MKKGTAIFPGWLFPFVYCVAGVDAYDEWMLIPLTKTESRDLLEIVEARYERSSTIFCSQFAPPGWHERIAEDALADAVLDRIENSSYKILIDGDDSMRKRKGFQSE